MVPIREGLMHRKWECLHFFIVVLFLVCLGECLGFTASRSGIIAGPEHDWRMSTTMEVGHARLGLTQPASITP